MDYFIRFIKDSAIKVKKLHKDAIIPTRSNPTDSGLDLYSVEEVILEPGKHQMVSTGIAIELPESIETRSNDPSTFEDVFTSIITFEAQIRPRSGLAAKHGITVLNTPGTVDQSYRGGIKVILLNTSDEVFIVERGMRIAQMVICPVILPRVVEVDELSDTDRGDGGFGSTGI